MDVIIEKNIRDNPKLRESFNDLAVKTFDLSFKPWFQGGFWADKYIPYSITDKGKIVANVSVNIVDTIWKGCPKRYIQLGTVMTAPEYRKRGLSRCLIEEIFNDWQHKCDAVYLFANDTVLDFYPKFGFVKEKEYQYKMNIDPQSGKIKKLDMSNAEDCAILKNYYLKSNPFSALPMIGNYGLLMFYCAFSMRDCIYYSKEYDAVIIFEQDDENLICYDVFCDNTATPLVDILSGIASKEVKYGILGFTPKDISGCVVNEIIREGETLFVLNCKDNVFATNKVMFPRLSHA